jgi:hypothetical protein
MTERWLPVPAFEGYYEVSDLGRVKSVERTIAIPGGGVGYGAARPLRERILRQNTSDGYPYVSLAKDGRTINPKVHGLVLAAFVGPRPDGQEGRHLDGNRGNCALSNLAYSTHVENCADQRRHGTLLAGEAHPHAKLTTEAVAIIKALRLWVDSAWMAAALGVSRNAVRNVGLSTWMEVAPAPASDAVRWLRSLGARHDLAAIPPHRRGTHTAMSAEQICAAIEDGRLDPVAEVNRLRGEYLGNPND